MKAEHEIKATIKSLPITQENVDKHRELNGPCGTVGQQWDKHADKTKPMMALIYIARKLDYWE